MSEQSQDRVKALSAAMFVVGMLIFSLWMGWV